MVKKQPQQLMIQQLHQPESHKSSEQGDKGRQLWNSGLIKIETNRRTDIIFAHK